MSKLFANREVCDLIFQDYATKDVFLRMNYANTSTTEVTGETVFAYGGKGHPRKVSFSGERGGTLTIETQMQSFELYRLLTGGDLSTTAKFMAREELVVATGAVTLSATPSTGATVNVFKADDDCGTPLSVSVSGTRVTVTGAENGDTVIVYYVKDITEKVQRISIKATSFPKAFTVYGDTVMKTEDDQLLPYKFVAYKAVPQSNMSVGMANTGDPATITITADLLVDDNGDMLDLILEEE